MNEYIDSEDMTQMDKNFTSTSKIEYNNSLLSDIDLNTGKQFDSYRSNYSSSILFSNFLQLGILKDYNLTEFLLQFKE